MQPGSLIEFCDKNRVLVAVCQHVNKQQVHVLTEQNKEFKLPTHKIAHILSKSIPASTSRFDSLEHLKSWSERFRQVEELDLAMLWEFLEGEQEPQSLKALSELYFSDTTDEHQSLLLRILTQDRVYFEKKSENTFVRRNPEVVKQIIAQQEREERRRRERSATIAWLKETLTHHQTPATPPEGATPYLTQIQQVAIQGKRANQYDAVAELFQEAGVVRYLEDNAFEMMVQLGIWDEDVNLGLLEHNVPQQFSHELYQEIAPMSLANRPDLDKRLDLRNVYTLTIDDSETADIDDALSWEETATGFRLGIHIADAAAWVQPDTGLDREAVKRFTSIYLCERKIEMLPAQLSEDICSLVQEQDRLALSILIDLDQNQHMSAVTLAETIIRVDQRFSYEEVDTCIREHAILSRLLQLAEKFKQNRLRSNAVEYNSPELRIKVTADKQIFLKKVERNSPAQHLVSELMIVANHLVAKQLKEAGVPLIYKVQEGPTDDGTGSRPFLKKAEMSTTPGQHYGLGLDIYTQFTSPIRRYNDLVLHRQIKAWLHQTPPRYSAAELQFLIMQSEQALYIANLVQRESYRYWLYKYLQQLENPVVSAEVLHVFEDKIILNLPEYCLDTPLYPESGQDFQVGEHLKVVIAEVNPRKGILVLRKYYAHEP